MRIVTEMLKDLLVYVVLWIIAGIIIAILPHPYERVWPAIMLLAMLLSLAVWYFPRRRS